MKAKPAAWGELGRRWRVHDVSHAWQASTIELERVPCPIIALPSKSEVGYQVYDIDHLFLIVFFEQALSGIDSDKPD